MLTPPPAPLFARRQPPGHRPPSAVTGRFRGHRRAVAALGVSALLCLAGPAFAAPLPAEAMAPRLQACTACHGPQGRARADGYVPPIAGKPAGYLERQLRNFRDGHRPHAVMSALLEPLSDAYLGEIAHYFANLPFRAPAPAAWRLPQSAQAQALTLVQTGDARRGLPACAACHGESLSGIQPGLPGLTGLPADYLMAQLGAWRTGQRRGPEPDCMAAVARRLLPEEVVAVSHWLASRPHKPPAPDTATPATWPMACGALQP